MGLNLLPAPEAWEHRVGGVPSADPRLLPRLCWSALPSAPSHIFVPVPTGTRSPLWGYEEGTHGGAGRGPGDGGDTSGTEPCRVFPAGLPGCAAFRSTRHLLGGPCQQALAGLELRSDSRHRCPCFNSSPMNPGRPRWGRGRLGSPRCTGARCQPDPPRRPLGGHRRTRGRPAQTGPPQPPSALRGPWSGSGRRGGPDGGGGPGSAARRAPRAGSIRFLWYLQFWQKSVFNLAVHIKIRTV